MLADFAIAEPRSVDEAVGLLSDDDETVRPIAGGTGLGLLMRYGFFQPTRLVSLRRLPAELSRVEAAADGPLTIGALATARDLELSPVIAEHAPMMLDALSRLSSVRVRNVATLGGSLAYGHPQQDLPPVLIALDAQVRARGRSGERWIPAAELFRGYYETALGGGELITEVTIPANGGSRGCYRKVTARTAEDWPTLGLAVRCAVTGGRMHGVRIAVGALADRAQRLPAAEQLLEGEPPTEPVLRNAADEAAAHAECHGGPAGSAEYRRALLAVHLLRALQDVTGAGT